MIGRNELCPCGSGKKYKKCCLEKDKAKDIARNRIKLGEKQFNNVIMRISEFVSENYKSYKKKFEIDFGVNSYELENLMNVYYLANYKYNKQSSLMMNYFNKHKQNINNTDAEVIENTLNSYMSVYQIKEKDINKILLRDVILGEDVYVEDIDLFSQFKENDYLLARIVSVANTKIFVDKVVEINEGRKTKIKNDIDNRFKQTKKKCKTKKQCLINNIKFIYQNLIEVRREYILDNSCEVEQENIKEILKTTKILSEEIDNKINKQKQEPMVEQIDEKIDKQNQEPMVKQSKDKIEPTNLKTKPRRQIMARLSKTPEKFKNRKRRNQKLEAKLKERIIKTRKIQGIIAGLEFIRQTRFKKEEELAIDKDFNIEVSKNNIKKQNNVQNKTEVSSNKVENIKPYKAEQIESKLENISMSKTEQKIQSKIENNIVAKLIAEDLPKEQCKIYDILISKVENKYKEKCMSAWKRFKKVHKAYKGNESGWAAAIEYYVIKNIDESVTQEQISKKYNISARTLGKRYKQLKIS